MSASNPTTPPRSSSSTNPRPTLSTTFPLLAPSPLTAALTDVTGHTILSSTPPSSNPRQSHALQSLTAAYLSAYDTASRMGLGTPVRVTIGTKDGASVVQTGTIEVGGEDDVVVGTVVGPEGMGAELRVASQKVEGVRGVVGRVVGEGRRGE